MTTDPTVKFEEMSLQFIAQEIDLALTFVTVAATSTRMDTRTALARCWRRRKWRAPRRSAASWRQKNAAGMSASWANACAGYVSG